MSIPTIKLLVTDLDNTLYDWVTYFTLSVFEMLSVAADILKISEVDLSQDIKKVHQKHHNTEHPFALLETDAVALAFPDLTRKQRAERMDAAFYAFNKSRKQTLRLYPGVREALETIQEQGSYIVGHTEATVPNALFRIRNLDIENIITSLYATEPTGDGHTDEERSVEFLSTQINLKYLAKEERKPDPRILLDICNDVGVSPSQTLYVGDSISRDVGMAKESGAWAALAEFGTKYDRHLWDQLVTITHWTTEDIERARNAQKKFGHAKPDVILRDSYAEVLDHFLFE